MAGDWLKFEKSTLDKPEVFEMAGILGIDPDAVVGKLLRVWNWFDDQSHDGNAPVTVAALLDRYAGVTGFVLAMKTVGWMSEENRRLILPKFDRHNGTPAKSRASGKVRTQRSRSCNANSNADTVTKVLPEKRREEKSIKNNIPPLALEIEESEKPNPIRTRIGKLLGRRESTKWDADELKAHKAITPIDEDDLRMMEEFYSAVIPKPDDFRRTTMLTLLRHWNGEVDKARAFKFTKPQ